MFDFEEEEDERKYPELSSWFSTFLIITIAGYFFDTSLKAYHLSMTIWTAYYFYKAVKKNFTTTATSSKKKS